MHIKTIVAFLIIISISCKNSSSNIPVTNDTNFKNAGNIENPYHKVSEIPAPGGFKRIVNDKISFAAWLENVSLKKDKTVYLYNGMKKINQTAQFAVLDIPVGDKDLQQCADAVMRLRASYLFDNKMYNSIVFYDNDKMSYQFTSPFTTSHFDNYLQTVFGMCGTASLAKQLKKTDFTSIAAGDVLIRGGFPGHAVIVMDVVVNDSGQKKYLLAQSYMPAQDIHILVNPNDENSPWYDVTENNIIETPEYTFYKAELMSW